MSTFFSLIGSAFWNDIERLTPNLNVGDLPTSVVATITLSAPFNGTEDSNLAIAYVASKQRLKASGPSGTKGRGLLAFQSSSLYSTKVYRS